MSILHCTIPDFAFTVAARAHPEWVSLPVGLLGADEKIWATSPAARDGGVQVGMAARQARARCPDVALTPLDLHACEEEHSALTVALTAFGLPVEMGDWGAAYIDLSDVTHSPKDAQPVCADYGRSVRQTLGHAPALGCNTGKFTARAAAMRTQPGRMIVVDHSDEMRFLSPLPIALLPLPPNDIERLTHLGIRTLGQFARLPALSIVERFGKAGKVAHQWANGRDDRRIRPNANAQAEALDVDFDAPIASRAVALDTAMKRLMPQLDQMAARLEGCRQVSVTMRFLGGQTRAAAQPFVEPISTPEHIRAALSHCLHRHEWPAEATSMAIALLDVTELRPQQLILFPDMLPGNPTGKAEERQAPFATLVAKLSKRYSAAFFQGQLAHATHDAHDRRAAWVALQPA